MSISIMFNLLKVFEVFFTIALRSCRIIFSAFSGHKPSSFEEKLDFGKQNLCNKQTCAFEDQGRKKCNGLHWLGKGSRRIRA